MIDNHFREIEPEYVLDEGGFGTRRDSAAGKLVFGVAVGEKQSHGCGCAPAARRPRVAAHSG